MPLGWQLLERITKSEGTYASGMDVREHIRTQAGKYRFSVFGSASLDLCLE